jgi:hypothetical protein
VYRLWCGCVDCADRHDGGRRSSADRRPRDDRGDKPWRDDRDDWGKARNPVCCKLGVFAVGHVVRTWVGGKESIGFALDGLEIVDVEPNALESVLECLLMMILRSVLANLSLPVTALELATFTLTPTQGPLIDVNRVLARWRLQGGSHVRNRCSHRRSAAQQLFDTEVASIAAVHERRRRLVRSR